MIAGAACCGVRLTVGWIPVATTVVRMVKGEVVRGLRSHSGGGEDVFEFAGADDGVDLGDVFLDFVAIALDEASGDDELLGFAMRLMAGHLEDGVDRFLLGRVDEGAGVDDQDVGGFGVAGDARAGVVEQAHHDFAVDEVFGAAEADESDAQGFVCGSFGFGCGVMERGLRFLKQCFFHTLYFTGCLRIGELARQPIFECPELITKQCCEVANSASKDRIFLKKRQEVDYRRNLALRKNK